MAACALTDYRIRHDSYPQGAFGSWLTVPLFVLAWQIALLMGNLALTLAAFIGMVVAWRWGGVWGRPMESSWSGWPPSHRWR